MENKIMNLVYESSITGLSEINTSFDSGILRVAYTNKNKNGSYIAKETFEKCLPSIFNCPIVCNYDRDSNDFGGHDFELVRKDDGSLKMINVTQPVGVIPESAKTFWEEIDGHEYLCVEALIWKRQEAYQKIKEDGIASESMEISIKEGHTDKDSGLFYIDDFEFTAFCLLGGGVAPCFEGASLELFSVKEMKDQMADMMNDLKEMYSLVDSSKEVNNKHPQENSTEGGKKVLDEKFELASKYGIDLESLEFSLEDFSIEELEEKFKAMSESEEDKAEDFSEDVEEEKEDTDSSDNFSLMSGIMDEIYTSLHQVTISTEWGEQEKYCFVDYDHDAKMVYCWDTEDWLLYGFKYELDGDHVVIDFDSKSRMKYVIAEYDEGEQESPFASTFEMLKDRISKDTELKQKYQEASDTIESMQDEIKELREFKAATETSIEVNKREELFKSFDDLSELEAFNELKENSLDYELETLEEKLFALRGRMVKTAKFSLDDKTPKIKVINDDTDKEPYGGLVKRHLK